MGLEKKQPEAIVLEKLKKFFPKEEPPVGTIIGYVFSVDNLLQQKYDVFDHMAQAKNFCNQQLKKWNMFVGNPNHSMQGSKPTNILFSFEVQKK